jgi:fumarate reductase flavoprotein subunit
MNIREYDVLVIGAGLAGERAAIEAHQRGARTALLSLVPPRQSHSNAAQGGIQASLDNMGEYSKGDNWELHFYDTVKGSDWGADQNVVERMVKRAPFIVRQMEHWGAPFSRTPEGKIKQRNFGGTSVWRCAYCADITGHSLLYATDMKVYEEKIDVFYRHQALSLIVNSKDRCVGAVVMDLRTGELVVFYAKATVIATGGYGRLFRESTNAVINRGDGMSLAFDTGKVPLGNMEAVQFHPTGLYPSWILITEGARGDGGYLRNSKGERFMEKYAPQKKELASRDVVSRSIYTEILEGRGFEGGYVHLDLTHLGAEKIYRQLRDIADICKYFADLDVTKEPIPIRPVQHYSMGGIRVNIDCEAYHVRGLLAAGEAACWDTHGFNRLGGNSVLETLVAGYFAGQSAAAQTADEMDYARDRAAMIEALEAQQARIAKLMESKEGPSHRDITSKIQDTLTDQVGIFRNGEDLQKAVDTLLELKHQARRLHLQYKKVGKNMELEMCLRVPGMVDVALAIAYGALKRTESRGAHTRVDFPKRDDENWLNRTLAYRTDELPRLEYEDVVITTLPPAERKY